MKSYYQKLFVPLLVLSNKVSHSLAHINQDIIIMFMLVCSSMKHVKEGGCFVAKIKVLAIEKSSTISQSFNL